MNGAVILNCNIARFFSRKKNFSLDLKARATLYQTNFDGITVKSNGEDSHWFDANVGLSVGFTYYLGKRQLGQVRTMRASGLQRKQDRYYADQRVS